jgi:hypothetical protein
MVGLLFKIELIEISSSASPTIPQLPQPSNNLFQTEPDEQDVDDDDIVDNVSKALQSWSIKKMGKNNDKDKEKRKEKGKRRCYRFKVLGMNERRKYQNQASRWRK